MADTAIKWINLENLDFYNDLITNYIDTQDAKSLKTVAISEDKTKLLFYRVSEPVGSTAPAYEIELPTSGDISGAIMKVLTAIEGNVPVFDNTGSIKDSGFAFTDMATKAYVDEAAANAVAKTSKLEKQIVTSIPTASEAKDNIIYLYKVNDAVGDDKYEEYILIGGEVVMIGSTSTDLTDYLTSQQTIDKIAIAKQEAIEAAALDATAKADKALSDAKTYTDSEISKLSSSTTTSIEQINTVLSSHTSKISDLETKYNSISCATQEDIQALFA